MFQILKTIVFLTGMGMISAQITHAYEISCNGNVKIKTHLKEPTQDINKIFASLESLTQKNYYSGHAGVGSSTTEYLRDEGYVSENRVRFVANYESMFPDFLILEIYSAEIDESGQLRIQSQTYEDKVKGLIGTEYVCEL